VKEWIYSLALSGLAALAPVQGVMFAAGFLIMVDLITGIWRSIKSGERINSNKLGLTLAKMTAYQMLIVTALVMQTFLIPLVPCVSLVAGAIAAREGLSVFENISIITGTDFVSVLIERLNPIKSKSAPEDKSSEK
jgi:hypothetical protein